MLTAEVRRPDRARPDRPGRATARLDAIVEERDADRRRSARIREINAGVYAFDAALLREALGKLSTDNDQGEEYLTDVFGLLVDGRRSRSRRTSPRTPTETLGCNDRVELAGAAARCCATGSTTAWMRAGVTHRSTRRPPGST